MVEGCLIGDECGSLALLQGTLNGLIRKTYLACCPGVFELFFGGAHPVEVPG